MQQSLFEYMVKETSSGFDWKQVDFEAFVQNARLSVRAKKVLQGRITSLQEFMQLTPEEIAEFKKLQNCGALTALELLRFQRELQQKLNIHSLQSSAKVVPEDNMPDFARIVNDAHLSVRATNVLLQNVPTLQELLELNKFEILNFKNCGRKTAREILRFQSKLTGRLDNFIQEEPQTTITQSLYSSHNIGQYDYLYTEIKLLLSERARKVLKAHYVDSLERFMALPVSTMKRMKNCGKTSIVEYTKYQEHVRQLLRKIHEYHSTENDSPSCCDLSPSVVYKMFDDIVMEGYERIDIENPFPSLKRWITEIYPKSENGQKAFMLRMGMSGNAPMKLGEIGQQLEGLTRERVRQIVEKAEMTAKHRLYQRRLTPLIQKIADVVTIRGGKVKTATLVSLVLAKGEEGENLQYATGFINFLSSLESWNDTGLRIDGDEVVMSSAFADLIKPLSLVIGNLACQHAEEILTDQLWSVGFRSLKRIATDWVNRTYLDKQLQAVSDAILEEAISISPLGIKKEGNTVYSRNLWLLCHGKVSEATEYILKNSQKAMHFTEVSAELNTYRTEKPFAENYVYSTVSTHPNLFLWDRGTFIHRCHVQIPHTLMNDIEKWSIDQLRKGVPFISAYGAFKTFEAQCLAERVPNETALYCILRELSHPLLTYPKLPYIYLNQGKVKRLSTNVVLEQFLQDSGGPVSHDELRSFALQQLYLKDFQFDTVKYELPNVIRTDNGGFLHTDCLDIDRKKLRDIVEYIQRLLKNEDHLSVARVFADKRISCKMLGIDGPIGLFSLLQLFTDDEFDFKHYPQIRRLSSNNHHKNRRIPDEIADYIREKGQPCSYQELQEVFVEKLGYSEQTVYSVRYKDGIFKYLRDCLIHIDTIGWNNANQDALEEIARRRYAENVKIGKPYGLVIPMIESDGLPHLEKDLYWTSYLLADILVRREHFKLLGNRKIAFVPIPNQLGIETLGDLVYELLKNEFGGGTNLVDFTKYLRDCGIIVRSLTEDMLGESQKVKIVGKEIVMKELLEDA